MIKVTHNLAQFKVDLARRARQEQYAAVLAATRTGYAIRAETPAYLDRALDRPTPFTKRGVFVQRATLQRPEAVVGFMPKQAEYLRYQEDGGSRRPTRRVIVLPSDIKRNQFGSIPRAELRRLYERAKADKRATPALRKRLGVSSKVDLFVGEPGDGLPAGIWKRAPNGTLVPIVVFETRAVSYRPRLGWRRWALARARARIVVEYPRARAEALATAR